MRSCTFNIPNRLLSAADRVEVEGVCGGRDAAELLREGGCAVDWLDVICTAPIPMLSDFRARGVPFRPTKLEHDNGTGRIEVAEHRRG
jgi:hypothetical protein